MRYAYLVLALVILSIAPIAVADNTTSAGATIITYTVPIQFVMSQNATVGAGNTTSLSFTMPYQISSDAKVYMSYKLTDANGTLLSNAENITLKVSVDGSQLTTIFLSSGSPAEALVPLSATPQSNITVELSNDQSSDVNAEVQITVLDSAKFTVSVSPQSLQIPKGGDGQVTVTITQESGPKGTVTLEPYVPYGSGITSKVTPQTFNTAPGGSYTAYWSFSVADSAKKGTYTAKLTGTFVPQNVPGMLSGQVKYTFAEVMLPIVASEVAAAGAGGFSLGAIAGYKIGIWAVAIAVLFLIFIIAVALSRK